MNFDVHLSKRKNSHGALPIAKRLLKFVGLLIASSGVMTSFLESGHVICGFACGGTLTSTDLLPWLLPYSFFEPDPHPLVTLLGRPHSRCHDSSDHRFRTPYKLDVVHRQLLPVGQSFVSCGCMGFWRSVSRYAKVAGAWCASHFDRDLLSAGNWIRIHWTSASVSARPGYKSN